MPCTETEAAAMRARRRPRLCLAALLLALVLAACGTRERPPPTASPAPPAKPAPAGPAPAPTASPAQAPAPTPAPAPTAVPRAPQAAPEAPAAREPRYVKLPAPPAARSWDELKLTAARRLVAAHPDTSYMGKPPEPLLGIPVLEVELYADGSVRAIKVLREPREAKETIQLAIDAVRRAAPYGEVSHLSRPWRFVEVFLFDAERRFKPATLDR